jgi:hypothetical protein
VPWSRHPAAVQRTARERCASWHRQRARTPGQRLSGLRAYRVRLSPTIAWKTVARTGDLLTKQFSEDAAQSCGRVGTANPALDYEEPCHQHGLVRGGAAGSRRRSSRHEVEPRGGAHRAGACSARALRSSMSTPHRSRRSARSAPRISRGWSSPWRSSAPRVARAGGWAPPSRLRLARARAHWRQPLPARFLLLAIALVAMIGVWASTGRCSEGSPESCCCCSSPA